MPESVTEEVLDVIAETQRLPREKITLDGRFEELGMDSMDAVNILFALEEKFDITIPDETVDDKRVIELGGTTLELIHVGRNHSDNTLLMRLPRRS